MEAAEVLHNISADKDENLLYFFRLQSAPHINSASVPIATDNHCHYHIPLLSMEASDYHVHAEAQLHQLHVNNVAAQVAGRGNNRSTNTTHLDEAASSCIPYYVRPPTVVNRNNNSYLCASSSVNNLHTHLFNGDSRSSAAELGLISCSSDDYPSSLDVFNSRGLIGGPTPFLNHVAVTAEVIPSTINTRVGDTSAATSNMLDLLKCSGCENYGSSSLVDLAAAADLLQQRHPAPLITGSSIYHNSHGHNPDTISAFSPNASCMNTIFQKKHSIMANHAPHIYRPDSASSAGVFGKIHSQYHTSASEYMIRNPNDFIDGGTRQPQNTNPHLLYNLSEAESNMEFGCVGGAAARDLVDDEEDNEEMVLFNHVTDHATDGTRLMEAMDDGHTNYPSGGESERATAAMTGGDANANVSSGDDLKGMVEEGKDSVGQLAAGGGMLSNVVLQPGKGSTKGKGPPAKNLMAERRRRKKLNDRLYTLRSVVPNISKMDRASILGDAIEYLKELLQRINDLHNELESIPGGAAENHSPMQTMEVQQNSAAASVAEHHFTSPSSNISNVNILPPCIKLEDCITELEQPSSSSVVSMHYADGPRDPSQPPKIEVRIREGKVLNIHMLCARRPGLLLSTMRALDSLGLDIQQAVISCFSGFALDVFRAEQTNENDVAVEEDIKRILLLTATSDV